MLPHLVREHRHGLRHQIDRDRLFRLGLFARDDDHAAVKVHPAPFHPRDVGLAQAGIVRLTEDYLLWVYDFEPGDFVVPEPQQPGGTGGQGGGMRASLKLAAGPDGDRFTPAQAALEGLAYRALEQADSPIPAEQIREAVRLARTPDDLFDQLARLYEGTDAEEFRDLLERALFAADVLGYTAETERQD